MKRIMCFVWLLLLCAGSAAASEEYTARRTELEHGYRIDYVNEAGERVISREKGYAAKIVTEHDQGVSVDMYLDAEEEPIALAEGQFGCMRQYDEQGRVAAVIYLNQDGLRAKTYHGYDEIRQAYDENGQLTYMWYYLNGEPITLKSGQAGVCRAGGKEYPVAQNGRRIFVLSQYLHQNHWLCWLAAVLIVALSLKMPVRCRAVMLICYGIFILYMTILTRESTEYRVNLDLFASYKLFFQSAGHRIEVIDNILLFLPLSVLLYALWPSFSGVLTVTVLFSAGIEAAQLILKAGFCQLDDVLNNGIGSLIGLWTAVWTGRLRDRRTRDGIAGTEEN